MNLHGRGWNNFLGIMQGWVPLIKKLFRMYYITYQNSATTAKYNVNFLSQDFFFFLQDLKINISLADIPCAVLYAYISKSAQFHFNLTEQFSA